MYVDLSNPRINLAKSGIAGMLTVKGGSDLRFTNPLRSMIRAKNLYCVMCKVRSIQIMSNECHSNRVIKINYM